MTPSSRGMGTIARVTFPLIRDQLVRVRVRVWVWVLVACNGWEGGGGPRRSLVGGFVCQAFVATILPPSKCATVNPMQLRLCFKLKWRGLIQKPGIVHTRFQSVLQKGNSPPKVEEHKYTLHMIQNILKSDLIVKNQRVNSKRSRSADPLFATN